MKYYPAYLDLRERPCVIVGGGQVAERKALSLLEAGAGLTVVSPTLTRKLQELAESGIVTHHVKLFDANDLSGAYLVIAATNSPEINSKIGKQCRNEGILVNVVSPPEESSFIVPSVVERGDLLIAVSTGGASPALSKKIRQDLDAKYGPEYELFLQKMELVRSRLLRELTDEPARRAVFQSLVDSDILDLMQQGKMHDADRRIAEITGLKMS